MFDKVLASVLYYAGLAWAFGAGFGGFLYDPAALSDAVGRGGVVASMAAAALALLVGHRWWEVAEQLALHQDADDEVDRLAEKLGHLADALGALLDRPAPGPDPALARRVDALEDKCLRHRLGGTCPSPTKPLESVGPRWRDALTGTDRGDRPESIVSSIASCLPAACPACNPPAGVYCCCPPAARRLRDPECVDLDVPLAPDVHDQPTAELRKPL